LKSKNELIGDILGLLMSPAANVIGALQAPGTTIAGAIKQIGAGEGQ
jgi:large subunit ribosomal protein L10